MSGLRALLHDTAARTTTLRSSGFAAARCSNGGRTWTLYTKLSSIADAFRVVDVCCVVEKTIHRPRRLKLFASSNVVVDVVDWTRISRVFFPYTYFHTFYLGVTFEFERPVARRDLRLETWTQFLLLAGREREGLYVRAELVLSRVVPTSELDFMPSLPWFPATKDVVSHPALRVQVHDAKHYGECKI